MKNSFATTLARTFILIALLAGTGNAWARPPRAREHCGVLDHIDRQTRSLTVRSSNRGKPLEAVWTKQTRFVRNGKFDSGAMPKKGARVCVFYRTPFFGSPFVTKIVWSNG